LAEEWENGACHVKLTEDVGLEDAFCVVIAAQSTRVS
jgi:hypothetical protein